MFAHNVAKFGNDFTGDGRTEEDLWMSQEASISKVGIDLTQDGKTFFNDTFRAALKNSVKKRERVLKDGFEDAVQGTIDCEVLKHSHGELGEHVLMGSALPAVLVQDGDDLEHDHCEVVLREGRQVAEVGTQTPQTVEVQRLGKALDERHARFLPHE